MKTLLQLLQRGPLGWALVLGTLLLGSRTSQAQVDTYTFAPSTGAYTPLPATATAVPVILDDDELSATLPLGFTFVFDGAPYTSCEVSSNGWLTFNTAATGSSLTNSLATGTAAERPRVAPFWDDLDGFDGTARYLTTGTAPNRVFTFEWLNWERLGDGAPAFSMQVQLVEGTNVVRFVYRQEATPTSGTMASIGLSGAGTGAGSFLSLSSSGAAPGVSSVTETTSISTSPATGQIYSFTPPVPSLCPTPRNLVATNITPTTATLTYGVSNTTPGPFTVLYGPTGFNPALPISSTNVYTSITTSATSVPLTGLTVQAGYQFYVTQNCGGANGNSTISNAGSFTTTPIPPLNDDCSGALNVPVQFGACVGQTSADNTAATTSTTGSVPLCGNFQGQDVWFRVTVPVTGTVTVQTQAPTAGSDITDTGMTMYSGSCTALVEIDCNDDGNGLYSQISVTGRTPGEVLYIRAWAYGGNDSGLIAVCATSPSNCAVPIGPSTGTLTNTTAQLNWLNPTAGLPAGNTYEVEYGLQGYTQGTGTSITGLTTNTYALTGLLPATGYCYYVRQNCGTVNGSSTYVGPTCFTTPLIAPANDEPCGAITLGATTVSGTNVGATTTAQNTISLPACSPAQLPKDVWYSFTATATTRTLVLTGTAAGMVRIFTTPSCSAGPFTQVFCQGAGAVNTSVGTVNLTGLAVGTLYYVAVSGYGGADASGPFTILGTPTATRAQADTDALLVYPNPSNTGQLTLRLSGLKAAGQATLLNVLGQEVRTQTLNATAEQTLTTRGLATGLYTLRVTVAGQVLTRKIVLE